jgi:hypothetical protein
MSTLSPVERDGFFSLNAAWTAPREVAPLEKDVLV